MSLSTGIGRTVRAAMRSWPETVRLGLLLLFGSAAGAVFLAVYLVVLAAIGGDHGVPTS